MNIDIEGDKWICHNGMHVGDPQSNLTYGRTMRVTAEAYQLDFGTGGVKFIEEGLKPYLDLTVEEYRKAISSHKFNIGDLVEFPSGVRLIVTGHKSINNVTHYNLGFISGLNVVGGVPENLMTLAGVLKTCDNDTPANNPRGDQGIPVGVDETGSNDHG